MTDRSGALGQNALPTAAVRRSRSDATVRMFYEFSARPVIGWYAEFDETPRGCFRGNRLGVVVKYAADDAFVVTA
jgi:hypothetical protein